MIDMLDAPIATTAASDWRHSLPVLTGRRVTLRQLEGSDAPALLAMLGTDEVARFVAPPPTTLDGFDKFIAWARREQQVGTCACFAVVPHGMTAAIGIVQVRQLDADFATAEWGFAIGAEFWGTGMFLDAAQLAIEFAFEVLGTRRLEARAAVQNGRGNGALRKLGAVQEAVLRHSFLCRGRYLDQVLWSILEIDWRQAKSMWTTSVHVH